MSEEIAKQLKTIVFELNKEEYALPVKQVGSIERVMHITRIPSTLHFVKGVINLRGVVTPIIDLRARFDLADIGYTESTRIIIVNLEELAVGLIVDAAYDVIDIPTDAIEPAPEVIGSVQVDYIEGVAKLAERLLILLNMDKVLSKDGMKELYEIEG
ncbi:chemotaxis protein CheW [Paraliobacillus sediminis]|uniref:chemotaxis protein CheW n=1 Tax=Paraliobacillus sediminis TaxID=1885916 RepID=UPI000E3B712B|nr:chemotaxis protein CheW [Paraliobacillus sediminis]